MILEPSLSRDEDAPSLSRRVFHQSATREVSHQTVLDRQRRHRLALATALGISTETLEQLGADDEARRQRPPDTATEAA